MKNAKKMNKNLLIYKIVHRPKELSNKLRPKQRLCLAQKRKFLEKNLKNLFVSKISTNNIGGPCFNKFFTKLLRFKNLKCFFYYLKK